MRRVVIIGAGAIGAGTAAELALRGCEHLLVGRGAQIRHIAEHGLTYRRPDGVQQVPLSTVEEIEGVQLREDDLLLMATKTQHVEDAAQRLAFKAAGQKMACQLPILTLQNGLEAERVLLRRFSEVYGGSILIPASYTQIGEVVSGAAPKVANFVLGRAPTGHDERCEQIAQVLRDINWSVQTTDDVVRFKAHKLLRSVKNGLDVLCVEAHEDERAVEQLGELLVSEAHAVITAAGIEPAADEERAETLRLAVLHQDSEYRLDQQSTWQSFSRGASGHEVDYLNGEIVLLGRLHGVPTPANAAVQRALGAAWLRGEKPGAIPPQSLLDEL
ncbi:ketopantoate reductase family protein [Nesterenkonia ebinurensis]|uniref:ketopantoate reductase family protein n=1 Tax=Nesterenkonia ebinurensis TaxID=2608252 RepID=UPI00168AAA71|nr:2-dehydropantoate 2-reductase N-terminal domain-containing protein [Nesterenkonia ebinurensis]